MLLRWGRRHHRRRERRGRIQEGEAIDVGTGAVGGFDGSGGDKELGFSKGSGEKVIELGAREEFPSVAVGGKALRLFLNNLSSGTEYEKWVTLGDQDHRQTSPPREKQAPEEVTSPNSFQLLQDIREEGEIDEDEELVGEEVPKLRNEVDEAGLDEATNGDDRVGWKKAGQGSGHRGKGRGRAVVSPGPRTRRGGSGLGGNIACSS
ncbi:hypothetical protein DY000_02016853 [Brassica cretica]|uniref:Uncharacterized protein n=1 Tax=Brassica cretica TaxID=69181 RepID=A0ABQ7CS43_BRACR|nr:hypothetical protein DY000_02016853 [Brassica cretica]